MPLVYKSDSSKGIWGIQDIVCATENDSRRSNRSYNPSAILSGIAPRRSRVLDSKYALTSPHYGSSVTSCVVLLSTRQNILLYSWPYAYAYGAFFTIFFSIFQQHMAIARYHHAPYAINMHKSTHNIIISIKEFGANVKKTSRLVLN